MQLVVVLIAIVALFAVIAWVIRWTDRNDMRAAIRETNAQFSIEGLPIPQWAQKFGPNPDEIERHIASLPPRAAGYVRREMEKHPLRSRGTVPVEWGDI